MMNGLGPDMMMQDMRGEPLRFDPMAAPQLPQRPGVMAMLGGALGQRLGQPSPPIPLGGVKPPIKMEEKEIGRRAGAAANAQLGAPPPMPARRFPNPMQAQTLDTSLM